MRSRAGIGRIARCFFGERSCAASPPFFLAEGKNKKLHLPPCKPKGRYGIICGVGARKVLPCDKDKDKKGQKKMNATKNDIKRAGKIALADETLAKSLKEWFDRKGNLPTSERGMKFDEWLDKQLEFMAGCIGENETVEHLVEALRVNAAGDNKAVSMERNAKASGFGTDICCYVEDNIVYAGVWVTGKTAEENKKEAETMAETFRKAGYSAELWVDEVDDTEVTVNAWMDFPLYLETIKK